MAIRRARVFRFPEMKRFLPYLIVGAVGLMTVAGGASLYRVRPAVKGHTFAAEGEAAPSIDQDGVHIRGGRDAIVTLEEFGDFQCPPCGIFSGVLKQVEHEYGGRLRVIFREFPLAIHAHAREAALAAEAAGLQGRFWEMHDRLYREQETWGKASDAPALFFLYARMLRLDLVRFKKDMQGPEAASRLSQGHERAAELSVTETPTIFVNNQKLPFTSLNAAGLHAAIDKALDEKTSR